jgi:two-component system, OmpR family, sensor histidine kinase KdpD
MGGADKIGASSQRATAVHGRAHARTQYDLRVQLIDRRRIGVLVAVAVPSLAAATVVVAYLQDVLGVPNPSAVYLVAVVATALVSGTLGAVVASVASFLLYNFLYTEPRFTLAIDDPSIWLSVVLLLFVGIVVGQLAALQRSRTEIAREREREAVAQFKLSRALATRSSTPAALAEIARILGSETRMDRVWISLGSDDAVERVAADTRDGPRTVSGVVRVLQRRPGDAPAEWARVHMPVTRSQPSVALAAYRVRIEARGAVLGSVWALRDRRHGRPDRTEVRLLAAAADQVGQALAHDRLAAESQAAAIARESDALKSALLQSVSHDLRTPLATIRAAAGTLRPGNALSPEDQAESADAIDREVEYLNRLVTNLLDLSRIEAGALRAERDVFELDDLVGRTLERLRPRLADRQVAVDLGIQAVDVDPIFLDEAVTNVIENALKYTPPETDLRIVAGPTAPGWVRLTIEDAGPGVPDEALPRLFDKFYRVPGGPARSRAGTGIGLAVVRGLIEATGGRVGARRAERGGLAIDIDLPSAGLPAQAAAGALP